MISEKSSPQQFSPDHHFASFVSGWGVGYCLRMMKFSLVLPEKPTAYSFPFFAHVVWNCLIFVFHSFFTQMSLFGKRPHCRVLHALHSLVIAFRCRRWLNLARNRCGNYLICGQLAQIRCPVLYFSFSGFNLLLMMSLLLPSKLGMHVSSRFKGRPCPDWIIINCQHLLHL